MKEIFIVSDTHFGHSGVCKFMRHDDPNTKLRPWDNPDEMDEALVSNWNSVVKTNDRVYHLGDVVINKRCLKILERLNGKIVLIKGNHDIFKLKDYLPYFEDIRAYNVINDVIMSHIPVHPDQKSRYKLNIHGHLHDRSLDDRWYRCVSVEQINYTPIHFDEILKGL